MNLKTALGRLRLLSLLEGISSIVLFFIAMPIKRIFDNPDATYLPGMIHGVLFVLYCLALLPVYKQKKWKFSTLFWAGFASIIPCGTFWADWKYFKD